MFAFGGVPTSVSYRFFHADDIPAALNAIQNSSVACYMINFQNDPASSGNSIIGSQRLAEVGNGFVLQPGDVTSWIPVSNLNLIWHKETDATTHLNYYLIGTEVLEVHEHILLEDRGHLLTEAGEWVLL